MERTLNPSIYIILCSVFLFSKIAYSNDLIAYSHLTRGYWQIWKIDPNSGVKGQVTYSPKDKREPAWINNSQKLIFRTANGQLFTVDINGQYEKEIQAKYKHINNPDYSEIKKAIVFVRFSPGTSDLTEIWKTDLKGTKSVVLIKDARLKYQPTFSPRGDFIAYVKSDIERKYHHLWVMKSDGGNPRQLTFGHGLEMSPNFSPDGKMLVFSSNRESNNFEIYTIDILSRKISRLTKHAGLDTSPYFSPDGKRIAFVSNRSSSQQIWIMNKNGENCMQLTDNSAESIDPVWFTRSSERDSDQ